MLLNHLNLPVPHVGATKAFFEAHFSFTCIDEKGGGKIAVLCGADGFTLVLMQAKMDSGADALWPDAFHVGFLVASRAEVERKHTELRAAGLPVGDGPRHIRGVYGFYFTAPGNILVEVSSDEAADAG